MEISPTPGKIHGLIDRTDLTKHWNAYDNRVALDGELDPDRITPLDAEQIVIGSTDELRTSMWRYWYDASQPRDLPWYSGVRQVVEAGTPDGLIRELQYSHGQQQANAIHKRAVARHDVAAYTGLMRRGIHGLVGEGVLTTNQAEIINARLVEADGQPLLKYLPMSMVEAARLALQVDHEELDIKRTDATDYSQGIYWNVLAMEERRNRPHNKVHETLHGVQGLEVFDITRDDGIRMPQATVVGVSETAPVTSVSAGHDYSRTDHTEINEGWADFMTRRLIELEPELGPPLLDGSKRYNAWANAVKELAEIDRRHLHVLTDAVLVDATSLQPTAKREAIQGVIGDLDAKLGGPGMLEHRFMDQGGRITDVYTQGAQ
jgi:hypothetical protein